MEATVELVFWAAGRHLRKCRVSKMIEPKRDCQESVNFFGRYSCLSEQPANITCHRQLDRNDLQL